MAKRKQKSLNYPNNLDELYKQKTELGLLELKMIEKSLKSDNPQDFIKAQNYLQNIENKKGSELKSFIYNPLEYNSSGQGYKYSRNLSNELLRIMAAVPQVRAIINTRREQCANYGGATIDLQIAGWTIAKKRNVFDDTSVELTKTEKSEITAIIEFLEKGGESNEWNFAGWGDFTKKLFEDSWSIDQGVFEVGVNRTGIPTIFDVYDGGTFYFTEYDMHSEAELKKYDHLLINGYLPKYAQVLDSVVQNEYYPWELCLGIRNATTWMKMNGYGQSEVATLMQVITWMLNSNQYNGNFFQQGSNPKGILNFKDNVDTSVMESFKQNWRNTLSGYNNSHKMAAISGGNLEWINMQLSNRDMEFGKWSEFLTVLACVVFRIDPSEVGFNLEGSKGIFGQDGQKERLRHSKEKGLEPFLKFWQDKFTKYIVAPLSKGKYEFKFTGLEPEDEEAALDRDIKILINGGMSVQDFFLKYSSRDLDQNKDMLLNQIALQYKQMEQGGDPESNQAVDEEAGESYDNPFVNEGSGENPFDKSLNDYFNKNLNK